MPRAKKTFDREDMYRRIMPTASKQEQQEVFEMLGDDAESAIGEINSAVIGVDVSAGEKLFRNKEIKWIADCDGETVLFNITERMVMHRLETALAKMRCCKCDRCKQDIVCLAMNELKPHYVVCRTDELEAKIQLEEAHGLEVTSAILRAILTIRKHPRH